MKFYGILIILIASLLVWLPGSYTLTKAQVGHDENLITAEDLLAKLNKGEKVIILDVRSEGQYKSSSKRIKDDIRVEEAKELDDKMKNISKDLEIVTYCSCPDESTSNYYVSLLKERGFKKAYALKGGYFAWLRIDGPIEFKK
ncbi:MAG: hypothetical protein HY819_23930 [Acidobacteria bacterium]|nr:hypothetical protein [Acidobacteriota bacterium]